MSRMTCSKCRKGFKEGDQITARVLSVYHEINKPGMDSFRFAVERPSACLDIAHLVCLED